MSAKVHHHILVTPLHWGLGHATRCIPLIRYWLAAGHRIVLASDGGALALLRTEFPDLPSEVLPAYGIEYRGHSMVLDMARQVPRIMQAIQAEHHTVARIVAQYGITHIVSDNRYGCYHAATHSICITHQLHLRIPNRALQWAANRVLHRILKRFDAIWVPDQPQWPGLAGALAHPPVERPPVRYIGWLSRMPRMTRPPANIPIQRVAVVLSGPEPQRSILESKIMEQVADLTDVSWIIVRGRTDQPRTHYAVLPHVEVVGWLDTAGLVEVLERSDAVVCRSGYSSLMDLAMTGHRALLVPTPGQTEQEYLAAMLEDAGGQFQRQDQSQLDLAAALAAWHAQRSLFGSLKYDDREVPDWDL
jgi:UDP:flavonoid glycosyltransferase YjiC (YdhE family)